MTFAEKLKEARKEAGITQQQLANEMQVPKRTIEAWEMNGKSGRDPAEWCQKLILNEINRIKHSADLKQLSEYLAEIAEADEKLKRNAGLEEYPSIIIKSIVENQ